MDFESIKKKEKQKRKEKDFEIEKKNEEKQKTENQRDQGVSDKNEKQKEKTDLEIERTKEGKEQELELKLDCIFDDSPLGFERATNEEHKLESQDPLEEVNLGTIENKRITYISKFLQGELKEEIIRMLHEYKDCFAWDYDEMPGLDRELVEHRLPMIPGKKPVKQSPRRFAPEVIEKIKGEIERLLKAKFIRTSRYPDWISNIVPVIKKNGKLRVCIDFRDLNMATPKDEYPMPIAENMIDAAADNEIMSLLDGYSGYNQIYIAANDVSKTAFRCPGALGVYEWVMMPFGLKNAGATYQRAMNLIFHDLIGKFVQVYIDDIIVGSKQKEDHLSHLKLSFERMRKHGLKMNPLKCAFGVTAGEFLGFIIHQKGIEVNQNKTKAIMETKSPSNKKELQSLLGKVNFLRRFISNLSGKTKVFSPLLRLKKEQEFRWHEEHQKAFDDIKGYLAHPPVLAPISEGKQLKLYISANDSTIAGMLAQDDEHGIERVIYYLSRMLVGAEIRYTPLEKLCLSLYVACTKLKYYIRTRDVVIFCRSNVIKYMLCKPILHSRVGKWALALTEYSLTFEPLKSIKGQIIADFLADHSRETKDVLYLTTKPWQLYFDGSKHGSGAGIGLLIISPEGFPTKLSFATNKKYSNNETEYQALITGLEILEELGARNVLIRGDSQLVIKQLTREYKCLNEKLIEAKTRVVQLLNTFDEVELQHILRSSNVIANKLAQMASGYKVSKECFERLSLIEGELIPYLGMSILNVGSSSQQDWRRELIEYLQNPNSKVERKTKLQALNYVLLNNELYKKGFDGVLFKCLGNHESYIAMAETHEGICGAHQAGQKMKWVLSRKGVYWPSMIKDCIEFAKSCEECQKHGPIQKVPVSELHSIIKPWPFRGWAMDLIGQIHPPSSKNHKYILVAIDYFTKWVEAIPLKDVEQKDIIDFIEDHIITRFGIPQTITTDQGTVFTGRKVAQYAESRGIKLITSTPYYAQANGQVEAANKVVIGLIKKHISNKPRSWHETLVQILWAYRNSPRDATRTSPYKLVYGHEAILPIDINLQSIHIQKQNELPSEDYWNLMYDELISLEEERLIALQNLVQQKEKIEKSYNKKVKMQRFRVGDLVLKIILPIDQKSRYLGKWSYNWEGPFVVEQVYSSNAYVIRELNSSASKVINGKYLKCFHQRMEC
uniref:Transposon Ty3-G Gag-Pol polyprotein n=1 Tax=Cajanus cajan TaxID=3821 RepID=A0A151U0L1_CAJCA|nr:Transposon Ty3-G Gag-Pol polyprotein [Cajanus cajan]